MKCSYCRTKLTEFSKGYCPKCGAPISLTSINAVDSFRGERRNALTRCEFDNALQDWYQKKLDCSRIVTDAWGLRKIRDFYDGYTEFSLVGGQAVVKLMNPFTGTIIMMVSNPELRGEMYLVGDDFTEKLVYSTSC